MASVKTQLEDFLEYDLPTMQFKTDFEVCLDEDDVYLGQQERATRSPFEVAIKHVGRTKLSSKTGVQRRHRFELTVYSRGHDRHEEYELSSKTLDVADEVVDRYDGTKGGLTILRAGLPGLKFERARARRGVAHLVGESSRKAIVKLEIDVWEC